MGERLINVSCHKLFMDQDQAQHTISKFTKYFLIVLIFGAVFTGFTGLFNYSIIVKIGGIINILFAVAAGYSLYVNGIN